MNEHEIRLRVVTEIKEILLDASEVEELTDEEFFAYEEQALETADLLMEWLQVKIVSVGAGGEVTLTIALPELQP